MRTMPTNNKTPNWHCDNPVCNSDFHFDCEEILGKRLAEMGEDEKPRCPYCGSFDTVRR